MGFYVDKVLPHIQQRLCGASTLVPHREKACAGLTGHVLEIGFGTGHNVPFYPPEVTRVTAVEPSDVGWRLAADRVRSSDVVIERSGLDGRSLPFPDDVFDSALSTFTLCSIPDVERAVAEVRRVLKPGGRLHFVEHGRSPDASVRAWQARINPINRRIAGGCLLDVAINEVVTGAGFRLERLDNAYAEKEPKPMGYLYEGVAVA